MSIKNPLTPAGIEPATFRFVAQHLNHCATVGVVQIALPYFPLFSMKSLGLCIEGDHHYVLLDPYIFITHYHPVTLYVTVRVETTSLCKLRMNNFTQ